MIQAPIDKEKTDVLADWAEASCLFGEHESVSKSELKKVLDEAGTTGLEDAMSNIWKEINLRRREMGEAYLVETKRSTLERTQQWTKNSAYAFQLLLSLKGQYESAKITKSEWNIVAKLFERLATQALKEYLQGETINVGYPRVNGVPKSFSRCIVVLCGKLGEELREKRMFDENTRDDKVDIVSWRCFGDTRPGQVTILVGCAAGENWKDKASEIKAGLDLWKLHIGWAVAPITAFAFPYVCLGNVDWRRLSSMGGVLLDRLRIALLFKSGDYQTNKLQTQLEKWCRAQSKRLPWIS